MKLVPTQRVAEHLSEAFGWLETCLNVIYSMPDQINFQPLVRQPFEHRPVPLAEIFDGGLHPFGANSGYSHPAPNHFPFHGAMITERWAEDKCQSYVQPSCTSRSVCRASASSFRCRVSSRPYFDRKTDRSNGAILFLTRASSCLSCCTSAMPAEVSQPSLRACSRSLIE